MNNPTDEQILAAVGRAVKAFNKFEAENPGECAWKFLESLIPVEKVWNARELKNGDKYWYVISGDVHTGAWYNDNIDKWNLAIDNVFPTKESAELYKAEKLKQLD